MTDFRQLPLAEAKIGQEVTVWTLENGRQSYGQGGTITALAPDLVITVPGVAEHRYDLARFQTDLMLEIEVPTDPTECVNYGPDCAGEVEWFDPSGRGRGAQRCEVHREERANAYANSIEPYAHCSTPPSWFDPSIAGESWDED